MSAKVDQIARFLFLVHTSPNFLPFNSISEDVKPSLDRKPPADPLGMLPTIPTTRSVG